MKKLFFTISALLINNLLTYVPTYGSSKAWNAVSLPLCDYFIKLNAGEVII